MAIIIGRYSLTCSLCGYETAVSKFAQNNAEAMVMQAITLERRHRCSTADETPPPEPQALSDRWTELLRRAQRDIN